MYDTVFSVPATLPAIYLVVGMLLLREAFVYSFLVSKEFPFGRFPQYDQIIYHLQLPTNKAI